jgi:hypothetical protein
VKIQKQTNLLTQRALTSVRFWTRAPKPRLQLTLICIL